ncbi:MAG: type III-A CRISPR-associated RAMP protein Csm4 [Syntrophomonadaceae bacterium]|jgi:CRISPR-associated protein Csm4|nr:type III-A CRISPR-associated RAMP protein Csm4 [Syntrophomonadaceae bacterium]
MRAQIVRMNFLGPLHIGNREGSLEGTLHHIPSDTLFSGLCNVYRSVYGKKELERLIAEGVFFRLSSAFPYYKDTYFLPRPLNLDLTEYGLDGKKAKRARYLDYQLFQKSINNSLKSSHFSEYREEPVSGCLIPLSYSGKEIIKEVEVPRVALDSMSSNSNIYYFNQVVFGLDSGLYCLVRCKDELWAQVKTCFRILGDEGIGGDRSSGKGLFKVDFPGFMEFPDFENPKSYLMLSLYYPSHKEASSLDAEYTLQTRSGYVYSSDETSIRRKTVTMLAEGAVIYSDTEPTGKLVDITPPGFNLHRVWRLGVPLSVASMLGKKG